VSGLAIIMRQSLLDAITHPRDPRPWALVQGLDPSTYYKYRVFPVAVPWTQDSGCRAQASTAGGGGHWVCGFTTPYHRPHATMDRALHSKGSANS
jgi:hypothetical protein